jgi:hypothetical protein
MSRPTLEVADIFRRFGAQWRAANEAHISLAQRRVMTAIETCRTAALGGCIVPGGGISPDGERWVRSRSKFFVSVRVLSALFRRLFLTGLAKLHADGELQFFGESVALNDMAIFKAHLGGVAQKKWVVYAKRPFAGPEQVLAYLARYTHRVAISNRRLLEVGDDHVSFRWKDYREDGSARSKVMRLTPAEFMRRFLLHVLPDGFHRIRHYGLLANGHRAEKLALCRRLLDVPMASNNGNDGERDAGEQLDEPPEPPPCPCCGGRMKVTETSTAPCRVPITTDGSTAHDASHTIYGPAPAFPTCRVRRRERSPASPTSETVQPTRRAPALCNDRASSSAT